MPLTPDPPFPKTQGDNIRSKDWNDAVNEVIRLDNAKVNRAGDRITGPLTVDGTVKSGPLSIGPWPVNSNYVFFGTSSLDQTHGGNYALLQSTAGSDQGTTLLNSPTSIQFRLNNSDRMVLAADGHLQVLAGGNPLHFTSTWAGYPDGAGVSNQAEISNDTGSFKTLMIVGNKSAGLGRRVSVWDRLDVNGPLSALNFFGGTAFRFGAGKTAPGDWKVYTATGIVLTVDTSAANFSSTPIYVTALHGGGGHWSTTGGTSVYSPSPTGFTIYLKWSDSSPLTPETAKGLGWHIQWIGVQL